MTSRHCWTRFVHGELFRQVGAPAAEGDHLGLALVAVHFEVQRVALGAVVGSRTAAFHLASVCHCDLKELVPGDGHLFDGAHLHQSAIGGRGVRVFYRCLLVEPPTHGLYGTIAHRDGALAQVHVALRALGWPGVACALRCRSVVALLIGTAGLVPVTLLPDVVHCKHRFGLGVRVAVLRVPRGDWRSAVLAIKRVASISPVANNVAWRKVLAERLEVLGFV